MPSKTPSFVLSSKDHEHIMRSIHSSPMGLFHRGHVNGVWNNLLIVLSTNQEKATCELLA